METKNEIWKDIKGFEGRYQVSNLGRVRSLDFTWFTYNYKKGCNVECKRKGKILKPKVSYNGYLQVCIKINGKNYYKLLHRLVANAFIPNPGNLPTVNHKDENKANNVVFINIDGSVDYEKSNLEWCTHKYNSNYGTRLQRVMANNIDKMKRSIIQIDLNGNTISKFSSISEACKATGISMICISSVLSGKRKTTHGYSFKYNDNKPKRESKRLKYSISFQNHNNTNKKKVDQYNADGNYITTYDSISAASKATGISKWQISSVCSGRRRISHGYIFRYSGI